jgi:hypothetical protein
MEQSPTLEAKSSSASQKIFPVFYVTRRFIAVFTTARYSPLSWARSIQSMYSQPIYFKIHFNIILLSTPWSFRQTVSFRFPHQSPLHASAVSDTCYMPRPSRSSSFGHPVYQLSCSQNSCRRFSLHFFPTLTFVIPFFLYIMVKFFVYMPLRYTGGSEV